VRDHDLQLQILGRQRCERIEDQRLVAV
jgi:hypothetical protein